MNRPTTIRAAVIDGHLYCVTTAHDLAVFQVYALGTDGQTILDCEHPWSTERGAIQHWQTHVDRARGTQAIAGATLCDQGQPVGEGFVARDKDGIEWTIVDWSRDGNGWIDCETVNARGLIDKHTFFSAESLGLYWR